MDETAPRGAVFIHAPADDAPVPDELNVLDERRRSIPAPWLLPIVISVLVAILAVASALDPRWHRVLDFEPVPIADGAWWRLFTAHLMHLTIAHAVLDTAGLLLVAWIFADELGWRAQVVTGLVGIAAVDIGLWLAQIDRYAGLSGVLHAGFAAGATSWLFASRNDRLARSRRLWGFALIAGLGAKLLLELQGQSFWLDGAGFPVVTLAHRWGAVGGVLCGLCVAVSRRFVSPSAAGAASRTR